MSSSKRIVALSARMLPRNVRDRYREQWEADLRDSPAVGIRRSEVAIASVLFALTFARSAAAGLNTDGMVAVDRVRYPAALALGGALLMLTTYANVSLGEASANPVAEYVTFVLTLLLAAFGALGPFVGLIMSLYRRGISGRRRLGIALLVLSVQTPWAASWLDAQQMRETGIVDTYASWGSLAYVGAIALITVAWILVGVTPSGWTAVGLLASFALIATAKVVTYAALVSNSMNSAVPITVLVLAGSCGIVLTSLFGFGGLRLAKSRA